MRQAKSTKGSPGGVVLRDCESSKGKVGTSEKVKPGREEGANCLWFYKQTQFQSGQAAR